MKILSIYFYILIDKMNNYQLMTEIRSLDMVFNKNKQFGTRIRSNDSGHDLIHQIQMCHKCGEYLRSMTDSEEIKCHCNNTLFLTRDNNFHYDVVYDHIRTMGELSKLFEKNKTQLLLNHINTQKQKKKLQNLLNEIHVQNKICLNLIHSRK